MSFYDNLISEDKPIIFPYNPSDNGEIVFERWKTRVKFFYDTNPNLALQNIEKEINNFLDTEKRKICDIKFNSRVDGSGEKIVVLLTYKERVE